MKDLLKNKLVWVIVAVAIIAGLYFIFKGGSNQSSTSSTNSTAGLGIDKEIQDKCLSQLHDDNFCKFAGTFANVKAYKISFTDNASKSSFELSKDAKGNAALTATQAGQTNHVVTYNGSAYVQDPSDHKWIKATAAEAGIDPNSFDVKKQLLAGDFNKDKDTGKSISYKKVGTEACGNSRCYKYQAITDGQVTGYMWIDTNDYLLRKMTATQSGSSVEITLAYDNINITEPSPVKAAQ